MTVAVGGATPNRHFIDAGAGSPPEIDVPEVDASVDDVDRDVAAIVGVGVAVIEGQRALIDAIDSPRRRRLGSNRGHHLIGFDPLDARIGGDRRCRRFGNVLNRKALQRGLV